jgi:hypothetical protein
MTETKVNSFREALAEKASELSLISSWASIVGFDNVRDAVRKAEYYLKREIARIDDMEPAKRA